MRPTCHCESVAGLINDTHSSKQVFKKALEERRPMYEMPEGRGRRFRIRTLVMEFRHLWIGHSEPLVQCAKLIFSYIAQCCFLLQMSLSGNMFIQHFADLQLFSKQLLLYKPPSFCCKHGLFPVRWIKSVSGQ